MSLVIRNLCRCSRSAPRGAGSVSGVHAVRSMNSGSGPVDVNPPGTRRALRQFARQDRHLRRTPTPEAGAPLRRKLSCSLRTPVTTVRTRVPPQRMCGDPATDGTAGAGRMVGWTIGRLLTTIDLEPSTLRTHPRPRTAVLSAPRRMKHGQYVPAGRRASGSSYASGRGPGVHVPCKA
jgi:hypothetical protein